MTGLPTEQPVFTLFNNAGVRLDWLRAPISYRVTPRHITFGVGDAELVVQGDDHRGMLLWQDGARVQVSLRGSHVLGGKVTSAAIEGPTDTKWTFGITDDAALLDQILGWPNPSAALTAQTSAADVRTGKLESVAKSLIGLNAAKQGIDVAFAADLGRGPTITTTTRMVPLADVLLPHFKAAGMNLTARWSESARKVVVDVEMQTTYPIQLSTQSATITSYRATKLAPTVTSVVVGDDGNGTARVFTAVPNTAAETSWGVRAQVFRSASTADAATTAQDTLNDGAPKSGLSVTLSETDTVRYGGATGLRVGQLVHMKVGELTISDVVREAVITGAAGQPMRIAPGVGGWDSNPSLVLAEAVRRLGVTVRRVITH